MLHAFAFPEGMDELNVRRRFGSVRSRSDNYLYRAM